MIDKADQQRLESLINSNYPNFFLIYLEDMLAKELACIFTFMFQDYNETHKIDQRNTCKVQTIRPSQFCKQLALKNAKNDRKKNMNFEDLECLQIARFI
jgi:RNA recognition motif-containing protein